MNQLGSDRLHSHLISKISSGRTEREYKKIARL
jgi:hypothetical protein